MNGPKEACGSFRKWPPWPTTEERPETLGAGDLPGVMRVKWWYRARMLAVLGLATTLAMAVPGTARAAAAYADGLVLAADTLYQVAPGEGVVHATSVIDATNVTPNKTTSTTVTQYYYTGFSVALPIEAAGVSATSGGTALQVDVAPSEDGFAQVVEIHLRSNLYYRQTRQIVLTFDIVGAAPRSEESWVRINPAFVSFYAWAIGDPGQASVRIEAPSALPVEFTGSPVQRVATTDPFVHAWAADDIADPDLWFVSILGYDEGALEYEDHAVDGHNVRLYYWPGDEAWRNDVATTMDDALPALEEAIDQPWPVGGTLRIREAVAPNVFGYAGWYLLDSDLIEMGERLDRFVTVHELSHAWFNDTLFDSRWINEGLADAFAALVVGAEFGLDEEPEAVDRDDAAGVELNAWNDPAMVTDDGAADTEAYGYNTSWWIVDALIDDIGIDGMQEVLAAAAGDEIAYVGAVEPESVDPEDDWRRFLDLLEERAGSTAAIDLFVEFVVVDDEEDVLDERAAARDAYGDLEAAAGDWALPPLIRMPMGEWEFEAALDAIEDAHGVLERAAEVADHAAAADLIAPVTIEPAFEVAAEDFAEALAILDEHDDTLGVLDDAAAVVSAQRGFFIEIGLRDQDPEGDLAGARTAFEADDMDEAVDLAGAAVATVVGAEEVGRGRFWAAIIRSAVLLLLALAILIWLIVRRRRRRSSAPRDTGSPEARVDGDDAGETDTGRDTEEVLVAVAASDRRDEFGAPDHEGALLAGPRWSVPPLIESAPEPEAHAAGDPIGGGSQPASTARIGASADSPWSPGNRG